MKYIQFFNTFLINTKFYICSICYFMVLMSLILLYIVENIPNKEKPMDEWMSRCVETFDWHCTLGVLP